MKEINLPPFYVGQKVVALVDFTHPDVQLKKGNEYIVLELKQCSVCKRWDIGFTPVIKGYENGYWRCCGKKDKVSGKYFMASSEKFAPITENFQSISLTEVLKEETKLIGVN